MKAKKRKKNELNDTQKYTMIVIVLSPLLKLPHCCLQSHCLIEHLFCELAQKH